MISSTSAAPVPRTAWAAGLLLLAAALPARAQEEIREATAAPVPGSHDSAPVVVPARIGGRIVLDGRLDEPEWRLVEPVTRFVQTEPLDGAPASERTEVHVLYDEDALLVGARLHDSSGSVKKRLGRRDTYLTDSDWFYVMLDTHHDHITAVQFSVNPAGVKRDELTSGGRGDVSWNAVWDAAVTVDSAGWTVEMRIPFSQLRFGSAPVQTWGIQLSRRIHRLQENSVMAHTPRSERGGVARYGHLVPLESLGQGRRFELQPYTLARAEYVEAPEGNPFRTGSDLFGGVGLDVKYRATSSMTLDATINPDFGQVEVDPAVVNLTAFETSFDEKRPFFVEGGDIFSFGAGSGEIARRGIYYSRRIGRAPQGSNRSDARFTDRPDAATILAAAKLSGRTSRGLSVGVLGALTGEEHARWVMADGTTGRNVVEPRTGYMVTRLRQDLRAGQTSVGGIATFVQRDPGDGTLQSLLRDRAITGGLDFTHQFLNRTWSAEGYVTFSHVDGTTDALRRTQLSSARYYARPDAHHLDFDPDITTLHGYAARLEVGKRAGRHWRGEANVSAVSPGYEINDVGFQTTVDRIGTDLSVTYVENTPSRHFRNWRVTLSGTGDWNYGGDVVAARASLNTNLQFSNYWSAGGSVSRSPDTWDDRLTRGGPLARDPGGYNISGNISSDSRRAVTGRLNGSYSRRRSGAWSQNVSVNTTFRPAEFWTLSVGPRVQRSTAMAQYITSIADSLMSATFGRRYIFAELRQTTVSMETRLNLTFSPDLTLELFAQPLASSAEYDVPAQLSAPRTYRFEKFGTDIGSATYDDDTRAWTIDPDGPGPAGAFSVRDGDFVRRSLRGNAVLRWEWRPGSTMFLVWQQRRAGTSEDGRFRARRDVQGVFNERADNVFVLKVNYWLNL